MHLDSKPAPSLSFERCFQRLSRLAFFLVFLSFVFSPMQAADTPPASGSNVAACLEAVNAVPIPRRAWVSSRAEQKLIDRYEAAKKNNNQKKAAAALLQLYLLDEKAGNNNPEMTKTIQFYQYELGLNSGVSAYLKAKTWSLGTYAGSLFTPFAFVYPTQSALKVLKDERHRPSLKNLMEDGSRIPGIEKDEFYYKALAEINSRVKGFKSRAVTSAITKTFASLMIWAMSATTPNSINPAYLAEQWTPVKSEMKYSDARFISDLESKDLVDLNSKKVSVFVDEAITTPVEELESVRSLKKKTHDIQIIRVKDFKDLASQLPQAQTSDVIFIEGQEKQGNFYLGDVKLKPETIAGFRPHLSMKDGATLVLDAPLSGNSSGNGLDSMEQPWIEFGFQIVGAKGKTIVKAKEMLVNPNEPPIPDPHAPGNPDTETRDRMTNALRIGTGELHTRLLLQALGYDGLSPQQYRVGARVFDYATQRDETLLVKPD